MASNVKIQQDVSSARGTDDEMTSCSSARLFPKFSYQETMLTADKLPGYSAILNRTKTEGIGLEDLDSLQQDLEAMLSAVVVRSRNLQKDISALDSLEVQAKQQTAFSSVEALTSQEVQVSQHKKNKISSFVEKQTGLRPKRMKETDLCVKGLDDHIPLSVEGSSSKLTDDSCEESKPRLDDNTSHLPQRRYEPVNKFWTSMDPFCTDISPQDMKFLEELIEKYETNQDVLKIPPLGRHYSECWAEEEMINQQCESHFEGKAKAKRSVSCVESEKLLRKARNSMQGPIPTPFREQIKSALEEENIELPEKSRNSISDNLSKNNKSSKTGSVDGRSDLERRILKAFEEEGILNGSENFAEPSDEVLAEMKKCQAELEVINKHNVQNLKRLMKLARVEVARQELRKRIEMVDNQVFENYRTLLAAKQKKLPLSKTLQEQSWKCLRERDELKLQLDALSSSD